MQVRLHIVAPHGCAPQWRVNAVQFGARFSGKDIARYLYLLRFSHA
jgi:hypothetical protein